MVMQPAQITVDVLAATRPYVEKRYGLVTVQIHVPLYIWVELLTHRRFSRNASSARAMSTARYTGMGYYVPHIFYRSQKGMESSNTPIAHGRLARLIWHGTMCMSEVAALALERLGVAKEQRNRLIPPAKMVKGVVTGTEDAWQYFLSLRNNSAADKAMQEFAAKIAQRLETVTWRTDTIHAPYSTDPMVNAARAALVSYNKVATIDDHKLAARLLQDNHLSPFEHYAEWKPFAHPNNLTCTPNDTHTVFHGKYGIQSTISGWEHTRARYQREIRRETNTISDTSGT